MTFEEWCDKTDAEVYDTVNDHLIEAWNAAVEACAQWHEAHRSENMASDYFARELRKFKTK